MIIAVDAMGGDFAPRVPIVGAIQAVNKDNCSVIFVGDETLIKRELDQCKFNPKKIDICHAEQQVEMFDPIVSAVRKKRSSIRVAYELHKKGEADGVVSAGHSGAMLAIGKSVLKTINLIDRPCISAIMPSSHGKMLLSDAGANVDCQPRHLLQFALLSNVYMEKIHKIENPKVALLNIGGEEGKGDELTKNTYELLKKSSLNFIGNIEGKKFFTSGADIVICDGFAGNVLLKSVQGATSYLRQIVEKEINASLVSKMGALLMYGALKRAKEKMDYARYAGAPLLGLRGVSIITHGSSSENAFQFAVNFARWAGESQLTPKVEEILLNNEELLKNEI